MISTISLTNISDYRKLLDAIGEALSLRFEENLTIGHQGIDAYNLLEADRDSVHLTETIDKPCYVTIRESELVSCGESSIVDFAENETLPAVLRGRRISSDEIVNVKALPRWLENITGIAFKDGSPIWGIRESHGCYHHYVSLPIPKLTDSEAVFQHFYGKRFLNLLPLLHFSRCVAEGSNWNSPSLRACFMFDDPNLHRPSYGFINFTDLIKHAKLHRYHASFATIPLDAWFSHEPTASLFRNNSEYVSLLIHGNNHIRKELARADSKEKRIFMLSRALNRISQFENRSGIKVSRVMAPPHGALSEEFLETLAQLGFEAACVSWGSLYSYNKQRNWSRSMGLQPSGFVAGLTILPRFRLSASCHNSVLVAAILGQPIIPVGHHTDVIGGLSLLEDLAAFINSLGVVHWADMRSISRLHYSWRLDRDILRVKMFTKHIEVTVPTGTQKILIERPWLQDSQPEILAWRPFGEDSEWKIHDPGEYFSTLGKQRIEIISKPIACLWMGSRTKRGLHPWPFVRRQLAEARDRLLPILVKFRG